MTEYAPNAVLTARKDLNDELAIFTVRPDGWVLPAYESGQYGELALPALAEPGAKLERRSYSIASPAGAPELEFYIVRVNGGYLTPALWALKPGDKLWLGQKIKGKFTLGEVHEKKDLIMVATGTGLAPFLSMLRTFRGSPPWRKVVLIHGSRYERDLGYREELEHFQREHPWFAYLPSLTREPEGSSWKGARGRVQELFKSGLVEEALKEPFSLEHSHFLLCGNPQMIDEVEALLLERGFHPHKKKTPGNVHVERYW